MKRGERGGGGGERRFSALRTKIFFQGRFVVVVVIRRFIPLSDGAKEFLCGTPKEEEGKLSQGERRKMGERGGELHAGGDPNFADHNLSHCFPSRKGKCLMPGKTVGEKWES